MDASENLRGYAGDPNHNMHPDPYTNSIIAPGSYTFLTGAMESPLKDQPGGSLLQAPPVPHEDGVEPQSSATAGNLIGTLFTNHLTGSFNASRSPPVTNTSNSWELTINGGSAGSLYAGGSNVNMPNILINGSGLMAGANSTPTAQLLIGGLQGGSFNDNNDHGGVYYPPSQSHVNTHAEAMQLIYVNGGYGQNAFSPDGRGGTNSTTLVYSSQDGADQNNNNSAQQSSYGVSFLTPGAMSQRALEAAVAIPLVSLNQDRHGNNQSFSNNWQRNGGNEHSFLPVNEESQSHQSLFGAALPGRHGVDQGHDLSHMHGGEHLQSEVGMHVENQSQGGNSNNISVNGQGLLSLSLSSHQPHFQGGQLPGDSTSEAHMVAQAAALAKTKELASRYIASTGANADLSRFRTPSRDDVMGSRFHQENHVGNSTHRKLAAGSSGSCNALTASQFLQSVQTILNELCKVTPLKRTSKPAPSTEQQFPLRSSSASVNAGYGYPGKEDAHSAMHAEASAGRGDPASSVGSLSDASHLVTVSHIPLQAEMMSDAARASGTSRDDLEFKKGQLIRMLDEVEARFRRYSDQLQVTCAGFNLQAGPNAATPYTILALQAMSRHFRCLKDAVKNQLKVVRRALGEEEVPAGINGETSRLRYVDQQIRQQRALQQLGMLQQHAWRPQRGLPERAVSVLRAWLFEHFLHPYPKDVDKMSLAKQTGLTRSQVSNWFINARVRLWKPMVEEMYVEEQRDAADLVMQGERLVREQANMHNSPYDHYEGNNRGRSNSTLQDELHANGQSSSLPNEYRSTATVDEGRDQDQVGPSANNITEVQQAQALYRQQDMSAAAGEHHNFSYENAREAKRSKTALETVSDAFNNTSMLIMHPEQGENNAAAKLSNGGSPEGATDLEARKLKGKAVVAEHEQEAYASGAFVSYNDGNNNLNHVHRYETVAGYVTSSRAAPTASTGVSLTLGLRHCDANMRSVAPILGKYDMDVDIARMDPLDREEYLHEGRIRGVNENGQTYEMQRNQQEENNSNGHLTREILPGGTGMANSAFEHHHEFNDGR